MLDLTKLFFRPAFECLDTDYIYESYQNDELRMLVKNNPKPIPHNEIGGEIFFPYGSVWMLEYNNSLIGWTRQYAEDIFTLNIGIVVVPKEYRRCGLGSWYISYIINMGFHIFKRVIWSTHENNPGSINLAEKFGFVFHPHPYVPGDIRGILIHPLFSKKSIQDSWLKWPSYVNTITERKDTSDLGPGTSVDLVL